MGWGGVSNYVVREAMAGVPQTPHLCCHRGGPYISAGAGGPVLAKLTATWNLLLFSFTSCIKYEACVEKPSSKVLKYPAVCPAWVGFKEEGVLALCAGPFCSGL